MKLHRIFYPVELLVIGTGIVAAALYALIDLPIRDLRKQYLSELIRGLDVYIISLLLILLIAFLRQIRRSSSAGRFTKQDFLGALSASWSELNTKYLQIRELFRDLRIFHALILTLLLFAQLKHLIPSINSRVFDPFLFSFEERLLGGSLPGMLHQLFGTNSAFFLSFVYTLFYPYVTLLVCVMVLQRRDKLLTDQFAVAFALTWLLGTFAIYAFPTWGPCFYKPELFSSLPPTKVTEMQSTLWEVKLWLERTPKHPNGLFAISGFPSLHIAIAALGTYYLHHISKLLAVGSAIFLLGTFLATIFFGWHYLIDDLAALPLAFLSYKLAAYVVRP